MRDEEHRIQRGCVRWFHLQYPEYSGLLFAVPNGGVRDAVTAAKLKDEGVVAGVADLILFLPRKGYHALCIEMKTATGSQRKSQKDWMAKVAAQGYRYEVCRSIDGFVDLVNGYIG